MFRFTIRDVLWLTVVVAVSMAWLFSSRRVQERLDRTEAERRQFEEQNRVLHAEAIATARLEAGLVPFSGPDPNGTGAKSIDLP